MNNFKPIVILSILLCISCVWSDDKSGVWNAFPFLNCAPNEHQMILLRMCFSRVTIIDATELISVYGRTTRFSASFVKLLNTNASVVVRTFSITADLKDQESSPHIINPVPQIINYQVPRQRNQRRDESSFGSIIYTDDLKSLESVIFGPIQHPFDNPDGIYLILLTLKALDDNWQITAASLLQVLWYKWHIMHAILLSTCDPDRKVAQYDPFYRDPETGQFGIVKWTNIDTITESNFWLLSKADDWQQYPIRATMFRRFPTLIDSTDVPDIYRKSYMINVDNYMDDFSGFDGVVLGNMAKALNFSVRILFNVEKYGLKVNNTSFNGALGDLIYDRADIAINSRFLTDYETNEIEFLFPILSDRFCVIAPSAEKLPDWTAIFRCFDKSAWTIIVVVQIICAIVWFVLRKQMPIRRGENTKFSLSSASFEMYKIFISYPALMPRSGAEMTFIASCLIVNLIITGAFRGLLFNSLSEEAYEKEIDTLRQLDDSQLKIITGAKSVKNIFGEPEDGELLRSLQSKLEFKVIDVPPEKITYCTIERFTDVSIVIKSKYGESAKHPPVHVVKECPRTYHLVYIVKKGTPFKASFNRILWEFFEAGFFIRWYNALEIALVAEMGRSKDMELSTNHALTMGDMQTAFYFLIIGLGISFIAFVAEVMCYRKITKQSSDNWVHPVYLH